MISIDSATPQVFGLVLAAGRSRRFNGDKRQALLPNGRNLLQTSSEHALEAFASTFVVLRMDDDPHLLGLSAELNIVRCAEADRGMAHSLVSGIEALLATSADAVAVLLADMPWIQVETLKRLAAMADPQRIVMPVYNGQRGHPVIIGRHFWPQLLTLEGDQGAKAVIAANAAHCELLESSDAGVLQDADTPQALEQANRKR